MKIIIKRARLAFPQLWEPMAIGSKPGSEPACSAMGLLSPATDKDMLNALGACIQQVASEKWGAKAPDVLKTLMAKGDVCLHNGNTKAEYSGFEGNWFVSARNKTPPAVVAKQRWQGKPIVISANGRPFQADDKGVLRPIDDLPFAVKAPYSGCYVNLSLDVWAQDNQYGKRINAKLLAVQFEDEGEAFSGGEGFSSTDFDDTSENVDGQGGGAFMGSDDGFFGGGAPAASTSGGFDFGGSPAADTSGGFDFGGGATQQSSGFSF